MGYALIVTQFPKRWVANITTVRVKKKALLSLILKLREDRKRESRTKCVWSTLSEKGFQIVEMWECECWNLNKIDTTVKNHLREKFPYQRPLSEERLLQEIKCGKLFGYVQCDIEVPEQLRIKFVYFSPILKNTLVSWENIGHLMKDMQ